MSEHSIFGATLRPDQARLARLNAGMMSPLWLPFLAMAGAGAAFWTFQAWSRLATGATLNGGASSGAPTEATADAPVQPDTADTLPAQAEAFHEALLVEPAVTQSLAVQGDDETEATPAEPAAEMPAPAAKAQAAPKPAAAKVEAAPNPGAAKAKATPKPVATKTEPKANSKPKAKADEDHPAPTMAPHEGLPSRRKGGQKKR